MVKNPLLLFSKGIAMGSADVVPGVSGGTIAFITGIYDELLDSIKKVGPAALKILFKEGFFAFWHFINGSFLLTLGCGILLSLFSLARLISWLLVTYPIPLWSFFVGLILVSVWHMLRQTPSINARSLGALAVGAVFAWWFSAMTPMPVEPLKLTTFFVCGAIAICAMILPGISGSFLLLLLGVYEPVLHAVSTINLPVLGIFAAGCITGLMVFSRLLSCLLTHARNITLGLLTGMMLGSVNKLWPWKQPDTDTLVNILPTTYQKMTGEPSQLAIAAVMALVAITLVLTIERIAAR